MINILCATHLEAKPLIRHFELKKDMTVEGREVFRSDDIKLAVSGIGKVKAAIAASILLSESPLSVRSEISLFNVGICGAAVAHPLGRLLWINKITDAGSKRRYYPDNIIRHSLPEASLETHDLPVMEPLQIQITSELVDMEAAGFFEAARSFVPASQIGCLKVVSDHLEKRALSKEYIGKLIEGNIQKIEEIFTAQISFIRDRSRIPTEADQKILDNIFKALKLTLAQKHLILDAVRKFQQRNSDLTCLLPLVARQPHSKAAAKKIFNQLRDVLLTP